MNPYTIESTARILTHGGSSTPASLEIDFWRLYYALQYALAWYSSRKK